MDISVRPATTNDAAEIARLSTELGYPSSAEQIEVRLSFLLPHPDQFVAVAEHTGPALVGWVAAESRLLLESGWRAEITGLVVEAAARRCKVGARLVAAVESWAAARDYASIVVRSNASRSESHPFYLARGYSQTKTQHVYAKPLAV
jgi:GNAT superfamily N-acetyltransferase